jgi:two-component system, chemotaxis family, sensor kinase CheA
MDSRLLNEPSPSDTDGMDEVIKEFLVESNEGLDRFDSDLLALEKDKSSRELLDSVFRAIHTIKGTGGVLGYEKLVTISHAGETLLSRMRDGLLMLSPEIATALLTMADALRCILQEIASSGTEGNTDCSLALEQLSAVLNPAQATPPQPTAGVNSAASLAPNEGEAPPRLGDILVTSDVCERDDVQAAIAMQKEGDPRPLGQILVEGGVAAPQAVTEALKVQNEHRDLASNTIRVDVALLDKVMNLVGELVLARNQVLQFTGTQEDSGFLSTAQRLNLITTELQEGVMKTRMQPIGNVWTSYRALCVTSP